MGQESKVDLDLLTKLMREDTGTGRMERIARSLGICKPHLYNILRANGIPARPQPAIDITAAQRLLEADPVSRGRLHRVAEQMQVDVELVRKAWNNLKAKQSLANQRSRNGGVTNKTRDYRKDPRYNLVREARVRALQKGLEFDLHPSDIVIPDTCPVLGIPVKVGAGKFSPNSPNLDRVDNSRGYVWDNVLVISCRANTLKSSASLQEIQRIASFYGVYKNPSHRNPVDPMPQRSNKSPLSQSDEDMLVSDKQSGMSTEDLCSKYALNRGQLGRILFRRCA